VSRDDVNQTQKQVDEGTLSRAFAAVELLASAHASRAKDEAGRDLSRIGSGAVLLAAGALFLMFTLLLADVLAVVLLVERAHLALTMAVLAVAGVNLALGLVCLLIGRARLKKPVLVETRATLKRAAIVMRG
jgi:hypothetical protein